MPKTATNLNGSNVLLLDIFSIITQCNEASDIFNKSAFANRKLVVITYSRNVRRITWSLNTKNNLINNLILYRQ